MHRWASAGLRALACVALALLATPTAAMSREAQDFATWIVRSRDHAGLPFAVVDKQQAQLHVFDAQGHLAGSTPALLGATRGDHIVPGVGERAQYGAVRADERTTPAGRFVSEPGFNQSGEHVVWVDYESAFAIHRVRPGRSFMMRVERLGDEGAAGKRLSEGCVVVPVAFYQQVVQRVLGASRSVVYVMPETRSWREWLRDL